VRHAVESDIIYEPEDAIYCDYLRDSLTISELCALYGVSRKTGYKWIDRYLQQGPVGLEERSRHPHRSPNQYMHRAAGYLQSREP
jgi:transposase-like protein